MNLKTTKSPRRVQGWGLKRLSHCAAPLLFIAFCGCDSVTYDMHQMHQPVVINGNPFLDSGNAGVPALAKVDSYAAEVNEAQMTASNGNATTTQINRKNNAQVAAFAKIGGQSNRAILNVTLDANFTAVNALMALGSEISIKATGDVGEFPVAVSTNNPAAAVINASAATTNTVPVTPKKNS